MEQWGSRCPYLRSSETAAKGTDLAITAGKEDPVELDSSLSLWNVFLSVAYLGVRKNNLEIPEFETMFCLCSYQRYVRNNIF